MNNIFIKALTRRAMMLGGAGFAGLTAMVFAGRTQANTQKPPEPKATTNRNGKFAGKVVLITGVGIAYEYLKCGSHRLFWAMPTLGFVV